jgi:hypothetical protein
VVDCDDEEEKLGRVGAAGFWTSEHAEKSSAPRSVPTSEKREAFMSDLQLTLCW